MTLPGWKLCWRGCVGDVLVVLTCACDLCVVPMCWWDCVQPVGGVVCDVFVALCWWYCVMCWWYCVRCVCGIVCDLWHCV